MGYLELRHHAWRTNTPVVLRRMVLCARGSPALMPGCDDVFPNPQQHEKNKANVRSFS